MRNTQPPPPLEDPTRSVLAENGAAPPAETLCLLVSTANGVEVSCLRCGASILGRAADANIVVNDPSVSRHHAKLTIGNSAVTLVDLGSRNGSRVDGKTAVPHVELPLRVGSAIELGATTLILQRAAGFSNVPPAKPPRRDAEADRPIVRDAAMTRLYGLLDVVAPSSLAVIIMGETGTGKEVFAEEIHKRSTRAEKPFLKLNCAAIAESLLEGELFGYERGAFTGAAQAKAGLFESADGGTVFLDEVGEVSLPIQAKLLRVLENGETLRLGSIKTKIIDVRIISATNRDLRAFIAEGRFRSDLYFRLNGVALTLPSLRKRVADILPLAERFVDKATERLKTSRPRLTPSARAALESYDWPGNVRELRQAIERAVVMCQGGDLRAEHLMLGGMERLDYAEAPPPMENEPSPEATPSVAPFESQPRFSVEPDVTQPILPILEVGSVSREALQARLEEMDRKAILQALEQCGGNQSAAAKLLGMTRRALIYRIEQYGFPRPRRRQ